MISAADELKIFENILAQSPEGLSDPQLIGKFAKAKSMLHRMDSFNALQNIAPATPPMGAEGTIAPESNNISPNMPLGENIPQNQPTSMEGQGALNLP
jgi:hypothetical protein